jgi:hypothetical protein
MALIGLSTGAGIVLICWLVARRSERRVHAQKLALLRRRIERRRQHLAEQQSGCHTGDNDTTE